MMDGSDRPFFTVLHELARKLDNLPNKTNTSNKSERNLQSLEYIKQLRENLNNNIFGCNNLYQNLQHSYVNFRSIADFTSLILEQQKTIIETQESFLEEHGYVPYCPPQTTPSKTKDEQQQQDNSVKKDAISTTTTATTPLPAEDVTDKDTTDDKESPRTPQLKDFGLSHYALAQLQKPAIISNNYNDYSSNGCYNNINYVSTPANFQHNGLFLSPGVLGRIPPLFTPDTGTLRNGMKTQSYIDLLTYSSQKKGVCVTEKGVCVTEEKQPSHNIRKKLQMNNEEEFSTNKHNQVTPRLNNSSDSQQQLDCDVDQIPATPQLGNHRMALMSYSKDYAVDELPAPPKLTTRMLRSHISNASHCPKSVDLKRETPATESLKEVNLPSPPLLHTTFISTEPDSVGKHAMSFLPAFLESDKENLADIDVPKPPKLNMNYESRRCRAKKEI